MGDTEPNVVEAGDTRRFLTFRLDRRQYALAAEDVVEVIRTPQVARVPQAPKALVGIANLRGTVLPLASLRGLLGLDEVKAVDDGRAIVLDEAMPAALAVDSVASLVSIASARVETRPAELAAEDGEQLSGAFEIAGLGVFKILDIKALLEKAFAQRSERQRHATPRASTAMRREEASLAADTDIFVTFDVAGQEYALALSAVQEIVSAPAAVTPMPRAEALVVGMMAFRDRLLPLLSLRGLLGFDAAAVSDGREKVIVASVGGTLVGLIADRTRAIVAAEHRLIDPIPAVLAARSGGEARISAIYRGDGGRRLISILAPEQLFREDVMQRLGSGQAASTAMEKQSSSIERQFLVFRLGDDEFGLPIEAVDEVAHVPEQITRVPKTPKFLEGVVNLRGEVLPVVDQRKRFDMPKADNAENRRLIVVRTLRHRAGLIVDSVSEILRSTADAIEPPPDLTGDITRLVHGVINLEGQKRIVLLLEPAELLSRAEHGLLDAFESKAQAPS
jgi:purine-binding chemotaxis protein CheW